MDPQNAFIRSNLPKALAKHFLKQGLPIPDKLKDDAVTVLRLLYKESNFKGELKKMKKKLKFLKEIEITAEIKAEAHKVR
jgi:hypothetical protein